MPVMLPVWLGSWPFAWPDPERDAHECWRHRAVDRTVDVVQPVAVPPVLARPLDRRDGDGRAADLFGLGLGYRHRQDHVVQAHSPRRRPFRTGLLVRPIP